VWHVGYETGVTLLHSKGISQLATLLVAPSVPIAAVDVAVATAARRPPPSEAG
jgi:hypothetical protein